MAVLERLAIIAHCEWVIYIAIIPVIVPVVEVVIVRGRSVGWYLCVEVSLTIPIIIVVRVVCNGIEVVARVSFVSIVPFLFPGIPIIGRINFLWSFCRTWT